MSKTRDKQNIISIWCFGTAIKSLSQEDKEYANKSTLMANLLWLNMLLGKAVVELEIYNKSLDLF